MSNKVTNRLQESTKIKLEVCNQRTRSYLSAQTIKDNVESNEWQISEIHHAISEAEADDFATQAKVDAVAYKWQVKTGLL